MDEAGPARVPVPRDARSRRRRVAGILLLVAGVALGLLILLQPWASCPDDDAPAACPVPPSQVPIHLAALTASGAAMVAGGALVLRAPPRAGGRSPEPGTHR